MKKLLSIVLAVAMMATMAFAVSAASGSMMPSSVDQWVHGDLAAAGKGEATVEASGDGYKVVNTKSEGWPNVYYSMDAEGFRCNEADDLYLNYDFEVVSGATNIIVLFAGQSPKDQASPGSFICLNGIIDPSYVNPLTGDAVTDVPVGKYSGSVSINDLGYREDLKDEEGNMMFSGCKVFAVGGGGTVIVNKLEIGPKAGDNSGNDNSGNDDNDNNNSGSDTKATTTTKKQSSSKDDNPKTGVESDAIALAVVVLAAAGVVTLSVVSKKAKSR